MKMYKVTVCEPIEGEKAVWFFSSESAIKAFVKKEKISATVIEPVEFPSGKKAIIEWLNANFNRDNG